MIETSQRKQRCAQHLAKYQNSHSIWPQISKTVSKSSHLCESSLSSTKISQRILSRMPSDKTINGCKSRAPTPMLMDTDAMQFRLRWRMSRVKKPSWINIMILSSKGLKMATLTSLILNHNLKVRIGAPSPHLRKFSSCIKYQQSQNRAFNQLKPRLTLRLLRPCRLKSAVLLQTKKRTGQLSRK